MRIHRDLAPYIPPVFADRCRLIRLKGKTKIAQDKDWNTKANYSTEDYDMVEHFIQDRSNYGILLKNNLIVIDCDSQKMYDGLPEPWKKSITIVTGRADGTGRHVYLDCPDSPPTKTVIDDPDNPGKHLGDIRGSDSPFYTVGPWSIHPDTGARYDYVDRRATLVTVTWAEITTELIEKYRTKPYIQEIPAIPRANPTSAKTLSESLGLRIEDFAMPLKPAPQKVKGDIQGAHPIHGSTTGMNFAINPGKNVWYCYRRSCGGDPVAWIAYEHCHITEEQCSTLTPRGTKGNGVVGETCMASGHVRGRRMGMWFRIGCAIACNPT